MKNYKEIEIPLGEELSSVMKKLRSYKEKGELVFVVLNGHKLYSDIDDFASAWEKLERKRKPLPNIGIRPIGARDLVKSAEGIIYLEKD